MGGSPSSFHRAARESVLNDICGKCGGDLDTGYECTLCGHDHILEESQKVLPVTSGQCDGFLGKGEGSSE